MATRKPRKVKTAAELKKDLEAAKAKVKALEAKAYEGELAEAIAKTGIVAELIKLCENHKDISAANILQAIGKAANIPRIVVTQTAPKPRASKKSG